MVYRLLLISTLNLSDLQLVQRPVRWLPGLTPGLPPAGYTTMLTDTLNSLTNRMGIYTHNVLYTHTHIHTNTHTNARTQRMAIMFVPLVSILQRADVA